MYYLYYLLRLHFPHTSPFTRNLPENVPETFPLFQKNQKGIRIKIGIFWNHAQDHVQEFLPKKVCFRKLAQVFISCVTFKDILEDYTGENDIDMVEAVVF